MHVPSRRFAPSSFRTVSNANILSMKARSYSPSVSPAARPARAKSGEKRGAVSVIFGAVSRWLIRLFYRTRFKGFEHIPERGPCLIVANHISYLDGVFIQAACKRPIRFLIDYHIYYSPFVHFFMAPHKAIPILPKRSSVRAALDEISEALNNGEVVMLFPEGQITYTGALGRFRPGVEWVLDRDPVPVYPVVITGLWDSVFSRKYRKSAVRFLPRAFRLQVNVTCGGAIEPSAATVPALQRIALDMLERNG